MKDLAGKSGGARVALAWLALAGASTGCQDLLNAVNDGGVDGGDGNGGSGGGMSVPGCGLTAEPEPNDTRDRATPLSSGSAVTACMVTGEDVDYYQLSTPDDAAGGYVQVALTDVGNGRVDSHLYAAA